MDRNAPSSREGNETEAPPAATQERGLKRDRGARPLAGLKLLSPRRLSAVYLLVLFFAVFGATEPHTFLTSTTLKLVFTQGVVTCVLALAFLVPLIAGVYDLAIGAVMSLAVAIVVYLSIHTHIPVAGVAAIALLTCTVAGCVSGFVVVRLRVSSFIATLGVSQVLLAAVLLISGNQELVGALPNSWATAGNGDALGFLPYAVIYLAALAIVLWFVLEHTRIGRYLFATGGNADASRLAGVRVSRFQWGALVASGLIAGIAGVIYSMQTGVFDSTTGPGYLFPAITAVFLGGSQLSHRPNVWGTLLAYFALAFGVQGLQLTNSSVAVWSNPLFQGVALIIAVWMASRPLRRVYKTRTAVREPSEQNHRDPVETAMR
jgi:ribose transport system permease protein